MSFRDVAFTAVGLVTSALVFTSLQLAGVVPQPVRTLRGRAAASSASGADSATAASPPVSDDEAWRTASPSAAETVRRTQQLLEKNVADKKRLERELDAAKSRLAAGEGDGAAPRDPFDLTQDDWKDLAKSGTVHARYPCDFDPDWHLGDDRASALGLAPGDVSVVEGAYKHAAARLAAAVLPGCGRVLGYNNDMATRLGALTCMAVIQRSVKDPHPDLQLVADVRAGNKPMPTADVLDPLATMLMAETTAAKGMEDELAKSLPPQAAHKLAYSDQLGTCTSTWDDGATPKR